VQHGNRDDEGTEEPVGHIDVGCLSLDDGAEEHHGIRHPYHGDQQVDRPLQLGVLLGTGKAQRQGDGGEQDDQLPAPEGELGQSGREQGGLAGTLHYVVAGSKQTTTTECEDHGIGVQRTQAAVGQPGDIKVQCGEGELGGNDYPTSMPTTPQTTVMMANCRTTFMS
jgi:hypothetical protein